MNLSQRNLRPELMDQPGLDDALHRGALSGLGRINRWSGTDKAVWSALGEIAEASNASSSSPLRVLELASGGGDVIRALAAHANRCGVPLVLHGWDISATAVAHAQALADHGELRNVRFFQRDALQEPLPDDYDVIFCTLFLHHLNLGLPRDVARTHAGFMGCHGSLNGLRVAGGFASSDPQACVLVCAVELCSLHHQYTCGAQQLVANSLFSDGAAAAVGRGATRATGPWQIVEHRSALLPGTSDLMSWRLGDHGFVMTLSSRVPEVIREILGPWLQAWLAQHGLSVDGIRSWAVHPGGPRILTVCAEAAGFDPVLLKPSQDVLAEFGNMSSPTVLFILQRLRAQRDTLPCVVLAFGPGLTIEAALIR